MPSVTVMASLRLDAEAGELRGHLVGAADAHAEDGEAAVRLRDGFVGRARGLVNRGHGRTRHDRTLRVVDDACHRSRGHTLRRGTTGRKTHDERRAQRTPHPSSYVHFSLSFRKGLSDGRDSIAVACDADVSRMRPRRTFSSRQTSGRRCPAPAEWRPFCARRRRCERASRPGVPCRGAGASTTSARSAGSSERNSNARPSPGWANDRRAACRNGRSSVWTARSCGGTRRWTPP